MRSRAVVVCGALLALVACDRSAPVDPDRSAAAEVVDVVPDYVISSAVAGDAAGIGGSRFPEDLQLTAEQKAAIAALHEAFMAANAADVESLRVIERQARAAIRAGKSREEVRAILATAQPILQRLDAAHRKLQADIWAVYTPEQRAWIESRRRPACGPGSVPLTEEQLTQIRTLRERFHEAVRADLALIRSVAAEARAAREAGKSREEIAAILARAAEAHKRVADAERRLHEAILAVLTPEQRERWECDRRR